MKLYRSYITSSLSELFWYIYCSESCVYLLYSSDAEKWKKTKGYFFGSQLLPGQSLKKVHEYTLSLSVAD